MNRPAGDGDPLAHLLRPLAAEHWRDAGHAAALLARLQTPPRPRRRFWLLAVLALASLLLLSATFVSRHFFTAVIVDVQRGVDGSIERITMRTDDREILVQLVPVDGEVPDPVAVELELERVDGGKLALRVLRDRDRLLVPVLRATLPESPDTTEPVPGARYQVRELPSPWLVRLEANALVLVSRASSAYSRRLQRLPTNTPLPRYGDDRIEVELQNP